MEPYSKVLGLPDISPERGGGEELLVYKEEMRHPHLIDRGHPFFALLNQPVLNYSKSHASLISLYMFQGVNLA